ncbi:hypothetical protein SAY87_025619 [Trapa incisa]|uniref:Uncharacterized protein n=2 Tax=Trapa TaxID=22665 RepID=A0AAN7LJX9_TRANT|nr:hypothetical protein SAY87_025619 [Trapa incisa]KAK4786189.1 hypothetical protein SAY86_002878 [Trapa natans]
MEANQGQDLITAPPSGMITTPHSQWHSPVPYLFGGLAAMLGLIAFALLVLACSYWKLSGYLDGGQQEDGGSAGGDDIEAGTGGGKPVFEEKILVIMAGEEKPTFLATPVSCQSSSIAAGSNTCGCGAEKAGERSEAVLENGAAAKEHNSSDHQGNH